MFTVVKVRDFMAKQMITLKPEMEIMHAISVLMQYNISGAPVTDNTGNLIGILSEKDCLKVALEAGYNENHGGPVSDYMSASVITVDADDSIFHVAKKFLEGTFKRFPVLENGVLVGQISRRDVLRAVDKTI